jgi:hypothetical protein
MKSCIPHNDRLPYVQQAYLVVRHDKELTHLAELYLIIQKACAFRLARLAIIRHSPVQV